jgi:hypothetical protein
MDWFMMQIGGGHLIIHRGKTSTTAVDRVVKLAHGRLSKIVPEAVRLRLETPQEVLLLEAEVWENRKQKMCDPPPPYFQCESRAAGPPQECPALVRYVLFARSSWSQISDREFFLIAEPANICGVDQALPQ